MWIALDTVAVVGVFQRQRSSSTHQNKYGMKIIVLLEEVDED